MNMMKFQKTISVTDDFDATVSRLSEIIEQFKFKILYTHDIQETLAGKGIEHGSYKIIEFCRAPAAKKVLDADPAIGLFLPCKMIVFEVDSSVQITAFLPTAMKEFFPKADLGDLPLEIEKDILQILDKIL